MPAPLMHIETATARMPAEADCVVIGAGITGVSAAYWLARAGQRVVLLEKGRIGAEQSSRNWGWCRQQNRDARELPLSTRSLDLWEEMTADIGEDLGFRRCGLLYLSDDEAEIEGWAEWGRFARGEGVDTRMIGPTEAAERGAATGKSWKGGVWSPTDGTADPSRAAPLIAKGVIRHGGIVLQSCAARGIETSGGAVSGVVAEHGTIRTRQAVVAGGAWAASFLHQLGIAFPQASVRSSILSVAPGAEGLPAALHTAAVSVTRRGDGGHTLAISGRANLDPTPGALRGARHFLPMFAGRWRSLAPGGPQAWRAGFETRSKWALDRETPMERMRILDPRPSARLIRETLTRAHRLLPALKPLPVQAQWAGYIDSTPDGVPVIDAAIGLPGLVLAAGLSGHGFGIGPGVGHLVADLALGRQPITATGQYRLARFDQRQWGKVAKF
ncbi:NAD(P)/FAD-dependent oxidoreductase [Paracoccus methylarcula]|uniref:FAD-binding oxidoreductase n=1 Tax=Paracoccus methylarcula TaxID=72022 RepID=A0A422QWK3_9RHOB|nr:FAD-binding oxidoreductase [Paracoccus methylarcula]RNF34372.1 FAD-binding oxidoreductase [Paracoccus methylarcula]